MRGRRPPVDCRADLHYTGILSFRADPKANVPDLASGLVNRFQMEFKFLATGIHGTFSERLVLELSDPSRCLGGLDPFVVVCGLLEWRHIIRIVGHTLSGASIVSTTRDCAFQILIFRLDGS